MSNYLDNIYSFIVTLFDSVLLNFHCTIAISTMDIFILIQYKMSNLGRGEGRAPDPLIYLYSVIYKCYSLLTMEVWWNLYTSRTPNPRNIFNYQLGLVRNVFHLTVYRIFLIFVMAMAFVFRIVLTEFRIYFVPDTCKEALKSKCRSCILGEL